MWPVLCVAVLAFGVFAPAASGARLALENLGQVGPTAKSDGQRYLAGAVIDGEGAPVTVFDTRTGKKRSVHSPDRCSFADIHHGTLLWSCFSGAPLERALMYDLATGHGGQIAPPSLPDGTSHDGGVFAAIGKVWARFRVHGYHYSYHFYVNRLTPVRSWRESPIVAARSTWT